MKSYSGIFLTFLCITVILVAGCTSTGFTTAAPIAVSTPTPLNVTPTTTPTVANTQDQIIGSWRYTTSTGYNDRFRFNADGKFVENFCNSNEMRTMIFDGTWSTQGNNSYTLKFFTSGEDKTYIFDPARKGIYESNHPIFLLTPYRGDVATASSSASTSTSTAMSSMSGDTAAVAKMSSMTTWMIPTIDVIGESLTDGYMLKAGLNAALLRMYIDKNLPEMRQLADGATAKKASAREYVAFLEDLRTSSDLIVQATDKYNSGDIDGSTTSLIDGSNYMNKANTHLKQSKSLM